MGIFTASANRADKREIYFPEHERAMAHYSYLSPDRKWLLISEMDRTTAFQPCRLMPFDGSSTGRLIGSKAWCIGAAWSPDGTRIALGIGAPRQGLPEKALLLQSSVNGTAATETILEFAGTPSRLKTSTSLLAQTYTFPARSRAGTFASPSGQAGWN